MKYRSSDLTVRQILTEHLDLPLALEAAAWERQGTLGRRPGTTVEKSFCYSGHVFPPAVTWEYLSLGVSGALKGENGYDSAVQIKSRRETGIGC